MRKKIGNLYHSSLLKFSMLSRKRKKLIIVGGTSTISVIWGLFTFVWSNQSDEETTKSLEKLHSKIEIIQGATSRIESQSITKEYIESTFSNYVYKQLQSSQNKELLEKVKSALEEYKPEQAISYLTLLEKEANKQDLIIIYKAKIVASLIIFDSASAIVNLKKVVASQPEDIVSKIMLLQIEHSVHKYSQPPEQWENQTQVLLRQLIERIGSPSLSSEEKDLHRFAIGLASNFLARLVAKKDKELALTILLLGESIYEKLGNTLGLYLSKIMISDLKNGRDKWSAESIENIINEPFHGDWLLKGLAKLSYLKGEQLIDITSELIYECNKVFREPIKVNINNLGDVYTILFSTPFMIKNACNSNMSSFFGKRADERQEQKQFGAARLDYSQALKYCPPLRGSTCEMRSNYELGVVYKKMGENKKALESLTEAMKASNKLASIVGYNADIRLFESIFWELFDLSLTLEDSSIYLEYINEVDDRLKGRKNSGLQMTYLSIAKMYAITRFSSPKDWNNEERRKLKEIFYKIDTNLLKNDEFLQEEYNFWEYFLNKEPNLEHPSK